jgi:hypothetical protein
VLGKFSSDLSVRIKPLTEMSTKEFAWDKVRAARGADNSAVLVVLNVKVRMQAQQCIPLLILHDLLWETFTFTLAIPIRNYVNFDIN